MRAKQEALPEAPKYTLKEARDRLAWTARGIRDYTAAHNIHGMIASPFYRVRNGINLIDIASSYSFPIDTQTFNLRADLNQVNPATISGGIANEANNVDRIERGYPPRVRYPHEQPNAVLLVNTYVAPEKAVGRGNLLERMIQAVDRKTHVYPSVESSTRTKGYSEVGIHAVVLNVPEVVDKISEILVKVSRLPLRDEMETALERDEDLRPLRIEEFIVDDPIREIASRSLLDIGIYELKKGMTWLEFNRLDRKIVDAILNGSNSYAARGVNHFLGKGT
jgi:hypothetical protein